MQDLEAVLGRLRFALAPLEFLRPFLAPIYAWVAAVNHRGTMRLPWAVRFLFTYIAEKIAGDGRTNVVRRIGKSLGTAFWANAKAEGQQIAVGGWECIGGIPASRARWFALELDRRTAPWAYARGEPFRSVAALEMFATLLSFVLFTPQWPTAAQGSIGLTGITDNMGNTFAVGRLMMSKFPSVVILAELAEQLRMRQAELGLPWVPRDQNEEADDLTNGEFGRFCESERIHVDLGKLQWLVLDKLMVSAESLSREVTEARDLRGSGGSGSGDKGGRRGRTRPEERLRAKDPW
jgi:hypothetical protein